MTYSITNTSLDQLKKQAKALRSALAQSGTEISHSRSLELVARQYGYRNWNVLHAAVGNGPPPPPFVIGETVSGRYLGQNFSAEIIGVNKLAENRYRLTLDFAEPVDVVTFDSFSNFRSRVTCVVGSDGRTVEKTSDGRPHAEITMKTAA